MAPTSAVEGVIRPTVDEISSAQPRTRTRSPSTHLEIFLRPDAGEAENPGRQELS